MRFRTLFFQTANQQSLLPAPVIGGQQCRLSLLDAEEWSEKTIMEIVQPNRVEPSEEAKSTREQILQQLWVLYMKEDVDVTNPIQTRAELSYAVAVMDIIGG